MSIRSALLLAGVVALVGMGSVRAEESAMKQCADKWQAAKAAGTTGGLTYLQFSSKCRADLKAAPAAEAPAAAAAPAPCRRRAGCARRRPGQAVAPAARAGRSRRSRRDRRRDLPDRDFAGPRQRKTRQGAHAHLRRPV